MSTEEQKNSIMEEEKPQEITEVAPVTQDIVAEEEFKNEVINEAQVEPVKKTSPKKEELVAEVESTSTIITKVFNYGSCEMDQFWLPGHRSETARPYLNSFMEKISVVQIACGSLHILLLTKDGLLYSSGLNDDGALGRLDENEADEDSDKKPKLVTLPIRVNMISAGDSHSVAANSELGVCFQWGAYRNTEKSNLQPPTRVPTRVGLKEFENKTFQKVLSGSQHTLVLTSEGEVFGWGDPDLGVIGRVPKTRRGYDNALKVAKVTHHKAVDIFTGGRHSFLKKAVKKGDTTTFQWFSWGLNNFGQLGLQFEEDSKNSLFFEPQQMHFFDSLEVSEMCGGESHSIARLTDGTVYGFGRNDIGQLALGGTKDTHAVYGQLKEINHTPLKVDSFPESAEKIEKIWSGPNYCYARDVSGQCFSWGFGANFVLGNRKDENEDEYKPFEIPQDFFKNEEVPNFFSLGAQHVTYLVVDDIDTVDISVPKSLLVDAPVEYLPQHLRPSVTALAKELKAAKATQRQEEATQKKIVQEEAKKAKEQEQEKKRLAKEEEKEKEKEKEKKEVKSSTKSTEISNSKIRQPSKEPVSKKSKSTSRERSAKKTAPPSKPIASKGKKPVVNVTSNKKKMAESEIVKVSQVKNTKTIKKETASSKKK